MAVTADQYDRACHHFLHASHRLRAQWSVLSPNDFRVPGRIFSEQTENVVLTQVAVKHISDRQITKFDCGAVRTRALSSTCLLDSCENDDASIREPQNAGMDAVFKYFVHYSNSYCVPVLTFRTYWSSDGQPLTLQEVWRALSDTCVFPDNKTDAGIDLWQFVTEIEHPILHVPVFEFHPCRVESLMQCVQRNVDERTYIAAWLSVVGRFVGIAISHQFFMPEIMVEHCLITSAVK